MIFLSMYWGPFGWWNYILVASMFFWVLYNTIYALRKVLELIA